MFRVAVLLRIDAVRHSCIVVELDIVFVRSSVGDSPSDCRLPVLAQEKNLSMRSRDGVRTSGPDLVETGAGRLGAQRRAISSSVEVLRRCSSALRLAASLPALRGIECEGGPHRAYTAIPYGVFV